MNKKNLFLLFAIFNSCMLAMEYKKELSLAFLIKKNPDLAHAKKSEGELEYNFSSLGIVKAKGLSDLPDKEKATVLNLSLNPFKTLKHVNLALFNSLKSIILNSTGITHLPQGMLCPAQKTLESFFAGNNRIKSVPEGFFKDCSSLKLVFLEKNKLKDFPFEDLLPRTKVLLDGNRLTKETLEKQEKRMQTQEFENLEQRKAEHKKGTEIFAKMYDSLEKLPAAPLSNNNTPKNLKDIAQQLSGIERIILQNRAPEMLTEAEKELLEILKQMES